MTMQPTSEDKRPGALRWLWWLPLISLLAVEIYVSGFDGWGAWASAPLLLVPGFISLAIVIPGIFDVVGEIRTGRPIVATFLYTVVAALPILWLGVRRFFV
ncbi:MAG: hypothetical protein V3U67_03070 [Gemmatimonadota bacterium]